MTARARIALATSEELPDLDEDSALVLPELAKRGIDARPAVWTDPGVDWAAFDAVVVRSVWDYFLRADEWYAWLDRIAPAAPLWNPAEVVRWNSHKRYLDELRGCGVPVVDSLVAPQGSPTDLAVALRGLGWDDVIFKPAVAGGALGLRRVRGEDEARAAQAELDALVAEGDVLVQPFLASIVDDGELSLVYFGGALSHTLRKQAKPGDIRVQPMHGGSYHLVDPPREALDVAEAVLAAVGTDLLYARVDLVRADDGSLRLIELEAIEPLLFLELDPAAPGRYADSIAERVSAA